MERKVLSRSEEPDANPAGLHLALSEAEVAQRAAECVVDGETARVEICPVILHPPILAEGAEYWLD